MNSTEDFDDSWVDPTHKKELLITIKQIYNTSYTWAKHDNKMLARQVEDLTECMKTYEDKSEPISLSPKL